MRTFNVQAAREHWGRLTTREWRVLVGLVQGKSVRELAKEHGVSEQCIRNQRNSAMETLGLGRNFVELGMQAVEKGIVTLLD